MTYDARETSWHDGQPVELYEFRRGVDHWRYTSADADISYSGFVWASVPIERSRIEQGSEMNRSDLKITLPRDNEVALLFRAQPPGDVVTVSVLRQHRGDSDTKAIWLGRVINVTWRESVAELTCEPVFTSLRRPGLRRMYQLNCPHVLYGIDCNVPQLSYKTTDVVNAVNGAVISVAAAAGHPDGYYTGGFVHWLSATGVTDSRMIIAHTGQDLTLDATIQGLTAGENVDIYPGCNHTMSDCDGKFGNIENYGGFPFIPGINPFDGSMIF